MHLRYRSIIHFIIASVFSLHYSTMSDDSKIKLLVFKISFSMIIGNRSLKSLVLAGKNLLLDYWDNYASGAGAVYGSQMAIVKLTNRAADVVKLAK